VRDLLESTPAPSACGLIPGRRLSAGHSILLVVVFSLSCSQDEVPKTASSTSIPELGLQEVVTDELQWDEPLAETNLIVIISDTMRRDRIGIYGGPARTPAFDAFGTANLLFSEAYSQSPWTKPSLATAFTSLYPSQHGVLRHPRKARNAAGQTTRRPIMEVDILSAKHTTLPEVLQAAGLHTAGFVGNPWISRDFGFAQGFEVFDDSFAKWNVPGDVVSRAGLTWLRSLKKGSRFFLYLHYMDCHQPYLPLDAADLESRIGELNGDQGPVSNEVAAQIARIVKLKRPEGRPAGPSNLRPSIGLVKHAYDQGVEQFDQALKLFLDGFRSHPAYERTAIVITADHGEALFDRGYGNHGDGLYDDEVAIPFAARLPGVTSKVERIDRLVGLIDLLPTVCDYLQIAAPDTTAGKSWLKSQSSTTSTRRACLVTEGVVIKHLNRAIRTKTYKLLWQPQGGPTRKQHVLFNIREDPQEERDLLSPEFYSDDAQQLVQALLQAGRDTVPEYTPSPTQFVPVGEDVLRRLRSLGYVGGDDGASDRESKPPASGDF